MQARRGSAWRLFSALQQGQLGVVYVPFQGYGSIVFPAEDATLDQVRFAHRYGSGIIIVSLSGERLHSLDLQLIGTFNSRSPAFTASVDAAVGTTTGISVSDRLLTIRALADQDTEPADLARPGHVFPIRYNDQWDQHAADIASNLSSREDKKQIGVSSAILDDSGYVLDLDRTTRFALQHGLPFWAVPGQLASAPSTLEPAFS